MMRFTESEREVIKCVFFRADMSIREVAEETGLREHIARRILDNLTSKGVLFLNPLVNPFALGLREYLSYLSVTSGGTEGRQKLLSALVASAYTTFVGTIGGNGDICIMFATRDIGENADFFDVIVRATPGIVFDVTTVSCASVTIFPPKYLGGKSYGPRHQTYSASSDVHQIDDIDGRILDTLSTLMTTSLTHLAREVGIPTSTLSYRLDALKHKGILCGINYGMKPFNDGAFPCALHVHAGSMPREIRGLLADFCASHPAYTSLIEGVGSWTFDLAARIADPRSATILVEELKTKFAPYITKVSVIPINDHYKFAPGPVGLTVPKEQRIKLVWQRR